VDLQADIARVRTSIATKSVSLDEAERREERARAKARKGPSDSDIVLGESERILADYVDALGGQSAGARSAAP
jgi:hypothetical protein